VAPKCGLGEYRSAEAPYILFPARARYQIVLGFATGWLPPHTKALALAAHSEERRFGPLLKPLLRGVVNC
jgi:hypothetical protein